MRASFRCTKGQLTLVRPITAIRVESPVRDLVASATASKSASFETESTEAFCLPLSALVANPGTNASEARNAMTGPETSFRKTASHPARISFGTKSVTPHSHRSDHPMHKKGEDTQEGKMRKMGKMRKGGKRGRGHGSPVLVSTRMSGLPF